MAEVLAVKDISEGADVAFSSTKGSRTIVGRKAAQQHDDEEDGAQGQAPEVPKRNSTASSRASTLSEVCGRRVRSQVESFCKVCLGLQQKR